MVERKHGSPLQGLVSWLCGQATDVGLLWSQQESESGKRILRVGHFKRILLWSQQESENVKGFSALVTSSAFSSGASRNQKAMKSQT